MLLSKRLLCLLLSLVSHNNSGFTVQGSVAVYTLWSHLELLHYKPGSIIAPTSPAWKRQQFLNHTKPPAVVSFPICCFGILESVGRTHRHGAQSDHSWLLTSSETSVANRRKHLSILNSDVVREATAN